VKSQLFDGGSFIASTSNNMVTKVTQGRTEHRQLC